MPNDSMIDARGAPHPTGMAGVPASVPVPVYPGMLPTEDLKFLAIRCLQNPYSHVDKVRMKQSRSGSFKMLIWLEIEDGISG